MALPRQFESVRVAFKGVRVRVPLGAIQVFFGPNDAGKTNLLEGFLLPFSDSVVIRRDPVGEGSAYFSELTIDLSELAVAGTPDQEEFLQLVAYGQPSQFFQVTTEEPASEAQRPGWVEWYPPVEFFLSRDTSIPVLGPDGRRPRDFAEAIACIRAGLLEHLAAYATDWPTVRVGCEAYVDRALGSTRFSVGKFGIFWELPNPDPESYPLEAPMTDPTTWAEDMDEIGLVGPYENRIFIAGYDEVGPRGIDVVQPAVVGDDLSGWTREVESYVEALSRQLADGYVKDPWFETTDGGVRLRDSVYEACERLSELATASAPRFVSATKDIVVTPMPIERHASEGRRVRIGLRHRRTREFFDISMVGSGVRIWAAASLTVQIRRQPIDPQPHPWIGVGKAASRRTLYVFDEPERHLHPAAQDEAARWVAALAEDDTAVVVATHSVSFLNLPAETNYWLVQRHFDESSRVTMVNATLSDELQVQARQLGVSRLQALQLMRKVLVVEGKHDAAVIGHLYAQEVNRARVFVLPLFGAYNASAIAELEMLQRLELPIFVLFDKTRTSVVRRLMRGQGRTGTRMSREEQELEKLVTLWADDRPPPFLLSFNHPDIICGLPEEAVKRIVRLRSNRRFNTWGALLTEYRTRRRRGESFKSYFERRMHMRVSKLIEDIIAETPRGSHGTFALTRALNGVFASD
jgi:ABC-type cobalamin/Fe3+-siderophores transport system ATPase subunit